MSKGSAAAPEHGRGATPAEAVRSRRIQSWAAKGGRGTGRRRASPFQGGSGRRAEVSGARAPCGWRGRRGRSRALGDVRSATSGQLSWSDEKRWPMSAGGRRPRRAARTDGATRASGGPFTSTGVVRAARTVAWRPSTTRSTQRPSRRRRNFFTRGGRTQADRAGAARGIRQGGSSRHAGVHLVVDGAAPAEAHAGDAETRVPAPAPTWLAEG